MIKLWLDDKRPMPVGYNEHTDNAFTAIEIIRSGKVVEVSLDHDLGDESVVGNGYMVAKFIEEMAYHGKIPQLIWHVHSQNSVGVRSMTVALENADRYWRQFHDGYRLK